MSRIALAFVAFVSLVGCGSVEESASTESQLSDNACHYKCQHCPPNQLCAEYCVQSGNCGSICTVMALCIQGYAWDNHSCSCKPDHGPATGGACTSDAECVGRQLCCYPCGVEGCTNRCMDPAPGGGCPLFP